MNRRDVLRLGLGSAVLAGAPAWAKSRTKAGREGHVVVVGGGFGGATAAKYLRHWSSGGLRVTLVEREAAFVSCPMSNLVLAGEKTLDELTRSYDGLVRHWGIQVLRDEVTAVDHERRRLRLASGRLLAYDRLLLSPGVDFRYDDLPGLKSPTARETIVHAWKAGPQTLTLRRQLESMADGAICAITVPKSPYRCPPGPYERASLIASWLQAHKPRSKVLVLDANEDVQSKKALFLKAWADRYPDHLEYRKQSTLLDVDAASRSAVLEFERVKAGVLNVIPPQQAGAIAFQAGLKRVNERWVEVDWRTMESVSHPGIHVVGDAVFPCPTMPKSGHMANQHGKLAAAAIVRLMRGEAAEAEPLAMNTCYSYVAPTEAIHVASVHRYDAASHLLQPVAGAGGLSAAASAEEGRIAQDWARNIWSDMLD